MMGGGRGQQSKLDKLLESAEGMGPAVPVPVPDRGPDLEPGTGPGLGGDALGAFRAARNFSAGSNKRKKKGEHWVEKDCPIISLCALTCTNTMPAITTTIDTSSVHQPRLEGGGLDIL